MAPKWLSKFSKKIRAPQESSLPDSNWRAGLSKPALSREEFCCHLVNGLRDRFKDAVVESGASYDEFRIKRGDSEPLTIFLENIWRETRNDPEGRVERVEKFLRAIATIPADKSPVTKSSIVPMIKDHLYMETFHTAQGVDAQFVTEHFAGDLWIVYAIDTPDTMSTLQKSEAVELELDLKYLRPLAIENLRSILPPVTKYGDGPVFMLTAGNDYVASLLLFDDVWDELKATVDGDIVAAVPSRDVLLFTSANSKQGIEEMRASITRITDSSGYLVSETMFRLTHRGRFFLNTSMRHLRLRQNYCRVL